MGKKEKAKNGKYGSHHDLKVVEVFCFTGCRTEVEFLLQLVDIAASPWKLVLHVSQAKFMTPACILRTKLPPQLDVVII